jgi:hypothetical protein
MLTVVFPDDLCAADTRNRFIKSGILMIQGIVWQGIDRSYAYGGDQESNGQSADAQ